jgi:phospholipase C
LPVGLGFRVPCIVVSPWTVGGYVNSDISDHTSQLKFVERITGVKETNISDWRRRTVSDLTRAFRFNDFKEPPPLPDTEGGVNLADYEISQLPPPVVPSGNQTVPRQERGHRPRAGR